MAVRIVDFIMSMGQICEDHYNCCESCPFCRDIGTFHGCILDSKHDPEFAEIIKNETLKYMKNKEKEGRQEEADIQILHGKEELKEHDKIVYNQAIEDFAKDAKKMADRWFGNSCIYVPDINEIAENLKKV